MNTAITAQPAKTPKTGPETGPKTGKLHRLAAALLVALLASLCWQQAVAQSRPSPRERAQAAHELMHHGLAMVTEAADLVMISQLGLEPNLDQQSAAHGSEILQQGRELIDRGAVVVVALASEVDNAMLTYTQRLSDAYLNYADIVAGMRAPNPDSELMAVHHLHMLINHAVRMSAGGANLAMIGSRERDVSVAELAGLHGRTMLDNADITLSQVRSGPAMQRAHQADLTGEPMQTAHQLLESAREILALMDEMPLSTN